MKAHGENEGTAPIILDNDTRWTSALGQLSDQTALFPGIELSGSDKEEAPGGAQKRSGSSEEHRTLLPLRDRRPVSLDDPFIPCPSVSSYLTF
jgi:hypothetical protein